MRCHSCLSMTPILIDKIRWWCIACPFKGYCQQMLRINTVLICHKPQEKHGKQGSMRGREQVRQNSTVLGGTCSASWPTPEPRLASGLSLRSYDIEMLRRRPGEQHYFWWPLLRTLGDNVMWLKLYLYYLFSQDQAHIWVFWRQASKSI